MGSAEEFWNFSLRYYQADNVQSVVIDWQDTLDINVNLVLLVCWLCGSAMYRMDDSMLST